MRGLAVAGGPVEEAGLAGEERTRHVVSGLGREHQLVQDVLDAAASLLLFRALDSPDYFAVLLGGHRRWAGVARAFQRFVDASVAAVGEPVAVVTGVEVRLAQHLDQPLLGECGDEVLDDVGSEPEPARQLRDRRRARVVDDLQREVDQESLREAQVDERARLARQEGVFRYLRRLLLFRGRADDKARE